MDYLKKVLGIQTKYKESRFEGLPNFIYHIYHLHMADNPSFLSHQKKRQIRFPLSKKGPTLILWFYSCQRSPISF